MSTIHVPAEGTLLRRTWVNLKVCHRSFLNPQLENEMYEATIKREGKLRWGIAAWLLGLPLPIVIIAFLAYGCN
jgi:hypothetical protein